MEIKWEDPPIDGRSKRRDWDRILDEVRNRPGKWALVAEDAKASTAYSIKIGEVGHVAAGEFEAVSRTVNGKVNIYARFIGSEK